MLRLMYVKIQHVGKSFNTIPTIRDISKFIKVKSHFNALNVLEISDVRML